METLAGGSGATRSDSFGKLNSSILIFTSFFIRFCLSGEPTSWSEKNNFNFIKIKFLNARTW
jgi:hypothetical protein